MAQAKRDDTELARRLSALRSNYAAVSMLTSGEVDHVLNNSAAVMQALLKMRGVPKDVFVDKAREISAEAGRVVGEIKDELQKNPELLTFMARANLSYLFIRAQDPVPQLLDNLGRFEEIVTASLARLAEIETRAELEIARTFQEWLPEAVNDAAEILPRLFSEDDNAAGLHAT